MKRFIAILAVVSAAFLLVTLALTILSFDVFSLEGVLTSDGSFDGPVLRAFTGIKMGFLLTTLGLVLLTIVLFMAERNVLQLHQWSDRKLLIALLGLKIVLSAIYVIYMPYEPMLDDRWYRSQAINILTGQGVVSEYGETTAYFPIGYTYLLTALYAVFGRGLWVGQAFNILLLAGITLFTFLLARRLFGAQAARRAALVMTILPSQIFYSVPLLGDVLFAFLILSLLYAGTFRGTRLNTILIGILFGCATLARPTAFFFPLVIVVYRYARDRQWKPLLKQLVLIGMIGEALLLPWQIRNYKVFNQFVLVSTNGGKHMWMGNNPHASGAMLYEEVYVPPETLRWMDTLDEAGRDKYAFRQGLVYMLSHPFRSVLTMAKKFVHLYYKDSRCVTCAFYLTYEQISPHVLMVLILLTEGFYYALGLAFLISAFFLVKRDKFSPRVALVAAALFYLTAVHLVFIAEGRYHLPLMPLIVMVAMTTYTTARIGEPIREER